MSHIFFHITAGLYLVATVVFTVYLFTHRAAIVKTARAVLLAGLATHVATILLRWHEGGRFPTTTLHEVLTLSACIIVAAYGVFLYKYKLEVLGAFVAPFALVMTIAASLLPSEIVPLAPVLESYWLPIHVILAILGNVFFALTCVFGIMYLIQERYLKARKLKGLFFLLPSLDMLDDLSYRCLTYGFPLLTLAMITGAIWSEYSFGSYWMWKHRQVWSLIMWGLYAGLLHGRITSGWRGRKSAKYSIWAFVLLVVTSTIIYVLVGEGHGLIIER
ncbi:MAG: cytochrome c biogenesis protein CcsA [Deltaproteobacteria bacterium]|nr:cytochrome c biogenesis protein CcsA [Deltaproteobacteria bacterium]